MDCDSVKDLKLSGSNALNCHFQTGYPLLACTPVTVHGADTKIGVLRIIPLQKQQTLSTMRLQ